MSAPTWVIVPVSTIGCGKSTLFRALTAIYPQLTHIENDRIDNKRNFFSTVSHAVSNHPVVLIDRNNHMERHRQELFEILSEKDVNIVVVNFVNSKTALAKVKGIVLDRLRARETTILRMLRLVVGSFFRDFRPYNAREEDPESKNKKLDLDMTKDIKWNLRRLIRFFHENLGFEVPSDEVLSREVEAVKEYQVPEEEKRFRRPKKGSKREGDQGRNGQSRNNGGNKRPKSKNGNEKSEGLKATDWVKTANSVVVNGEVKKD
ncbi:uncharacterized protein CXQ87_005044 [Candidozyma duobushaemuli]|uniref:tRNA ligase kinase domain-containing protein n=1 Tax=Candidozyma duobushaemuli TaxID=1231522 RepID=A0A2V1AA14_9ASCO|nr:uncharacterized protein CXQ87_005044 [[Candida] duobushaemulonis]PVH14768.1 hypothetical protein CXQ87_005044 [[Candida] duobushaemulonis]